jgi:hypothetical protein
MRDAREIQTPDYNTSPHRAYRLQLASAGAFHSRLIPQSFIAVANDNPLLFYFLMGTKHAQQWCGTHGQVLAVGNTPNHILHLLLSIVTGFWLIVWLVLSIRARPYRCPQCGEKTQPRQQSIGGSP